MNDDEKHKTPQKVIYTVLYQCNKLNRQLDINQMVMYRGVICAISNIKKPNENWIFSIINITLNILVNLYKANDNENFFYFAQDSNYYLMDFLLDKRITTMSDREKEMINNYFKLIEAKLIPEINNIAQSDQLDLIVEFFVCAASYWYINNQQDLIERRRGYITAACLSVTKEHYASIRVAAMISIKALINSNKGSNNEELEDKLVELGEW